MNKVIPFKQPLTKDVKHMLEVGSLIDEAIIRGLMLEMESTDIIGVLAHRMGMLMNVSPDLDVDDVLRFCNKTIRKKCGLKVSKA